MQEVVCFNCGRIVHISPDAELCSVCGENLRELIHPAYASRYFYDRAANLVAGSDLLQALREVDRGLNYQASSELRLLGAILSQQMGDFEQMRRHVAAVPVDDVLRPEAEWLLRSHQERKRDERTARRIASLPPLTDDVSPFEEDVTLPVPLTKPEFVRSTKQRPPTRRGRERTVVGLAVMLLLLAVVTTGFALRDSEWSAILPWSATAESVTDDTADPAIVAPVYQPKEQESESGPILAPTATSAIGVPEDVVEIVPEPVAQGTLSALVINPLQPFDLETYLLENERTDLAQLGVAASSQEGTLLLDGIVPSYLARKDLIEIMEAAPGVSRVSGANLLVRLPPTYTVAAGDTLWAISYQFYGEDRIGEILAANRAVLPSSELLTIGMELTLPEIEP
ncbi:MAG: LysM peptidoglycan-binding domain-containing protein [Caldilineaceae bacterium]|nr:LysM peptidoglycan-binding domain-containing protein [Caldilineaceae bacterium]